MKKKAFLIRHILISMTFIVTMARSAFIEAESPYFIESSAQAGLNFSHQQTSVKISAITESLGSGACIFDFNNDGLQDLFLVGGSGHTREYGKKAWWHKQQGHALYQNISPEYNNIQFKNITPQSGIKASWAFGCAAGDFDNDGKIDLLVTNLGVNALYKNAGDGRFTDVTAEAGLRENAWSTSATLVDINQDGLLDIYVTNYIKFKKGQRVFEETRGFNSIRNTNFDVSLYDPQENHLYLNQGGFHFVEVAEKYGLEDRSGRGLYSQWVDVDKNGELDLIVINDSGSPSQLWLQKNGHFMSSSQQFSGITSSAGNRSMALADVNLDGQLDLLIGGADGEPTKLLITTNSNLEFSDQAWDAGLNDNRTIAMSQWASVARDFDTDGKVDLLFANGLVDIDLDTSHATVAQSLQLFRGGVEDVFGVKQFEEISPICWGWNQYVSHRSAEVADFDNDGDWDFVSTANNGPVSLWTNTARQRSAKKNWLGFTIPQRWWDSTITIYTNKRTQKYSPLQSSTFLGQHDPRVLISLVQKEEFKKIIFEWHGKSQELKGFRLGQYSELTGSSVGNILVSPRPISQDRKISLSVAKVKPSWIPVKVLQSIHKGDFSYTDFKYLLKEIPIAERSILIEQMLSLPYRSLWPIAYEAIYSQDIDLKISAIHWMQQVELEKSVFILIDELDKSNNDKVICEISKTFESFFREEEAVTHRKYLAIPHLIRKLDEVTDSVSGCLIDALGEAEAFRAVRVLANLLFHENPVVRSHAAYALGRIRHQSAEHYLLKSIEVETDPFVQVQVLVALSRIKYRNLENLVKRNFSIKSNQGKNILIARLQAFNELNVQGIALHDAVISELITNISSMEKIQNPESYRRLAQEMIKTRDVAIQRYFLARLPKIDSNNKISIVSSLLLNHNSAIEKELLNYLKSLRREEVRKIAKSLPSGLNMSDSILHVFEHKKIPYEEILRFASSDNIRFLQNYVSNVLPNSGSPSVFFDLCKKLPIKQLSIDAILTFENVSADKELDRISCILRQKLTRDYRSRLDNKLEGIFNKNAPKLAGKNLLGFVKVESKVVTNYLAFVLSKSENKELVSSILQEVIIDIQPSDRWLLEKCLKNANKSVQLNAINMLLDNVENTIVQDVLWLYLRDENNSEINRAIILAKMLSRGGSVTKSALDFLEKI